MEKNATHFKISAKRSFAGRISEKNKGSRNQFGTMKDVYHTNMKFF